MKFIVFFLLTTQVVFSKTYRVIVLSDFNGGYGSKTYAPAVAKAVAVTIERSPDLVLSTGDHVAGQRAGLDYRGMWQAFHQIVTTPLKNASIPFAPTPGNHDASAYKNFKHEREIFTDEWSSKRPSVNLVDESHYPLRYAFTLGPALFISLDATTKFMRKEQKEWVYGLLERFKIFPVKIIYGHFPLSPFAKRRETAFINDQEFENKIKEQGVSLFLSGHHHAYYPGKRNGLNMVSTGCLGGGPRPLLASGNRPRSAKSLLEIDFDESGILSLDAYKAPEFDEMILRNSLPERVGQDGHFVTRDDL